MENGLHVLNEMEIPRKKIFTRSDIFKELLLFCSSKKGGKDLG
jgi:hypothetical protein